MNPKNVLLVYKKSIYQIYFLEKKYRESSGKIFSPEDQAKLSDSHNRHFETLKKVKKILSDRSIRFREIYRARYINYSSFDLVIAVGGDGTFLEASKRITHQIILGVNSDPIRSIGNFLPCTSENFEDYLELIFNGSAKIQKLNRMLISVDRIRFDFHIVNDLLVAHYHPAAMSRYRLKINGLEEEQRGSGIWVSTAAGSSGAISAAGGKRMPMGSKRIQYLPRELFKGKAKNYDLTGGIIDLENPIQIESRMREGIIYIDGPHLRAPFTFGSSLEISNSPYPLRMVTRAE